ncbi:Phospho-2-dehydro-3-deoxyheptonate aldolase 1 [Forsythia ovata]|uniref:Phospho-2-dehydro-3-deoxyheptonate aldolase n=1 Tax=Forsythia ovata TaxID=205694 RepID=A0ABD1PVF1_9LAMI
MALNVHNYLLPNKSLLIHQTQHYLCTNYSFLTNRSTIVKHISTVHAADSSNSKNPIVSESKPLKPTSSAAFTSTAIKSKKALQLPEYQNAEVLDSVLKTLNDFPPIVFAEEARSLEEWLGEAAVVNAFLA